MGKLINKYKTKNKMNFFGYYQQDNHQQWNGNIIKKKRT